MATSVVRSLLRALREQLDMDVAFISEFHAGERVFRFVDTEDTSCPVTVDGADPLEDSYCQRVVDGRLPELIRDARSHPVARELPVTDALPVGGHLSVPIHLADGRIFGTLCCYRSAPHPELADTSVELIRSLAAFIAIVLEDDHIDRGETAAVYDRITTLLAAGGPTMVFQPIVELSTRHVVGHEALARFPDRTPPDLWFNDAWRTGAGSDLELAAVANALAAQHRLPGDGYLSVNLSPATLWDDHTLDLLVSTRPDRLVVEITEHAAIADSAALTHRLQPFTTRGGRVAIDDVGMGFSGLHQLVELAPDIIKLDRSLITNVDHDRARRAIVAALITYATAVDATVVAEGVETAAETATLTALGATAAQGYHFARPTPIDELSSRVTVPNDQWDCRHVVAHTGSALTPAGLPAETTDAEDASSLDDAYESGTTTMSSNLSSAIR